MTDKERWKIQNKLYHMKDRKLKLQKAINTLQETRYLFFNFHLISKQEKETFVDYFKDILKLFLLHLDKVLDFYYMKFKIFLVIKKSKKEINQLTKEIQYYEYKL
jgi:hypothetical protein